MIIRQLPTGKKSVYLTFDDGPNELTTPLVLDVLAREGVPATFFLIGDRIKPQDKIVQRMLVEGHALGDHSLDHRYRHFFVSQAKMKNWLVNSQERFSELELPKPVGFRPPAGVVTPPLKRALQELSVPLILWNVRFYDAVWSWTEARVGGALDRITDGSIVLLHDAQKSSRVQGFCSTLTFFIQRLRASGFGFLSLNSAVNELRTEH
jgi:peptidoglycan-N-acetylglucosamine deacetylase